MLDVGTGTGYYLGSLQTEWAGEGEFLGVDTSRPAIRLAARSYPKAFFVVASIRGRLPLESGSVDVLLDVFSPRNAAEFARLLAPGGCLITVIPGPEHLRQLRDAHHLLGIQENKEELVSSLFGDSFEEPLVTKLEYELVLSGADVQNLIWMTPNYWHEGNRPAVEAPSGGIKATASFVVMAFRRHLSEAGAGVA